MKLFKIYTDKDPIVRTKCKEISLPLTEEKKQVILDMIDYLKSSQDEILAKKYNIRSGVGLAAPQIGYDERFFAIYFDDKGKHYEYGLVNPKILSTSVTRAYLETGEGCLSVPIDVKGYVYRYYKVTMKAFDVVSNKEVTLKLFGYPAIVFQHEYDHLDGVLYYDRINKNDPFYADQDAISI